MPVNSYNCEKCQESWQYIGPYKDRSCPKCGELRSPGLPKAVSAPAVLETVDTQFNVKRRDNFEERAKRRNAFYTKKTAVERAREHGEDPKRHGITEDDPRPV